MDQLVIAPLTPADTEQFYALAAEYLPDSDPERMRHFASAYPAAYQTAHLDKQLIGVCYGWFRRHFAPEDPSFTLDGICISYAHWRKGYGAKLLRAFEDAARSYGAPAVSAGSGQEAEAFYIACGYAPKEYKCWTDGKPTIEHTYTSLEDYRTYQRQNPDGFVVMEKML